MEVVVRLASMEEAVRISKEIPEFYNPYGIEEYKKRLAGKEHLILAADYLDKVVGFKVGYNRDNDGSFYSWMGGVLPEYRQHKVALKLACEQENWARERGYTSIRFTTRNYLKAMLIFALKNGFDIIGFKNFEDIQEARILLEKKLNEHRNQYMEKNCSQSQEK